MISVVCSLDTMSMAWPSNLWNNWVAIQQGYLFHNPKARPQKHPDQIWRILLPTTVSTLTSYVPLILLTLLSGTQSLIFHVNTSCMLSNWVIWCVITYWHFWRCHVQSGLWNGPDPFRAGMLIPKAIMPLQEYKVWPRDTMSCPLSTLGHVIYNGAYISNGNYI